MSERRRRVTVPLPVLQPWSAPPADPFGTAAEDRRRIVRAQRRSRAVLGLGLGAITFGVAFLATGGLPTGAAVALIAVGAPIVVLADARVARLGAARRADGAAGAGGADAFAWHWGAGDAGGGWGDGCGGGFFVGGDGGGGGGGDGGGGGGGGGGC